MILDDITRNITFRIIGKDEVTSSNLVISSSKTCRNAGFFHAFLGVKMQELGYELAFRVTSSIFPPLKINEFVNFWASKTSVKPHDIRVYERSGLSIFLSIGR